MSSISCFLKKPLSWMFVIVGLVLASIFLGYRYASFMLTPLLILLSTHIINSCNHSKSSENLVNNTDQQRTDSNDRENEEEEEEEEEEEDRGRRKQIMVENESPPLLSESDCHSRFSTSEYSDEAESWLCDEGNICFDKDGSISDEESLIEIALPSGVYIDQYKKQGKEKVVGDFSFTDESLYKHQISLLELLAELNDMNEEDNLIEIDISVGSIKCAPRFEIQA